MSSEIYEQSILHGEKFLLVAVDIYNLHEINRKQGSNVGDKILMTVADALSSSCLGNEICCRCNGDHFYLIGISMPFSSTAISIWKKGNPVCMSSC